MLVDRDVNILIMYKVQRLWNIFETCKKWQKVLNTYDEEELEGTLLLLGALRKPPPVLGAANAPKPPCAGLLAIAPNVAPGALWRGMFRYVTSVDYHVTSVDCHGVMGYSILY